MNLKNDIILWNQAMKTPNKNFKKYDFLQKIEFLKVIEKFPI